VDLPGVWAHLYDSSPLTCFSSTQYTGCHSLCFVFASPGKCLAVEVAQIVNSASEQHSEACLNSPVILIKDAQCQQYQPYVKYFTWTDVAVHEARRSLPFVLPALDFTITLVQLLYSQRHRRERGERYAPPGNENACRDSFLRQPFLRISLRAYLFHIRTVQTERSCWCLLTHTAVHRLNLLSRLP